MGTKISWTNETWNPVTGCSKVSPGCDHCYAEALSLRYGWSKLPWTVENAERNVILHPERLNYLFKWKTPSRVFVNSMSDLFHKRVPDEYIDLCFNVMEACPQHIFQVLTKRPAREARYVNSRWGQADPPKNIWLGTSVEDIERAGRIDILRRANATVRFLSCEPLLGDLGKLDLTGIQWVIVGGESGAGFRPMHLDWARSIRDQCMEANVAFFFKQSSAFRSEQGKLLDGQAWEQLPEAA